jgi:rare lipoprotein A
VQVRVNDRGPFVRTRIFDVSEGAARALGMISAGVIRVKVFRCA